MVLAGYMMTFGVALTLFFVFIVAYVSGNFKVLVTINTVGEAHAEWFLLCFIMALSLAGFYGLFKIIPPKGAC